MTRRPAAGYGGEGRAITAGMAILHAAEWSDNRHRPRDAMAKVAYGAPAPLWPPFETTRRACAGPDDDARPACEDMDPNLFFPDDFRTKEQQDQLAVIRRICSSCPRVALCRDDGMGQEHGIWGGMTPSERKIRRASRRKARNV